MSNQTMSNSTTLIVRGGIKIAGILFFWSVLAAVSAFIADIAPRGSLIIPAARGLVWFFLAVGLANVLLYIVLTAVAFHHQIKTS